jgi:PAS domain S-box-containing protein
VVGLASCLRGVDGAVLGVLRAAQELCEADGAAITHLEGERVVIAAGIGALAASCGVSTPAHASLTAGALAGKAALLGGRDAAELAVLGQLAGAAAPVGPSSALLVAGPRTGVDLAVLRALAISAAALLDGEALPVPPRVAEADLHRMFELCPDLACIVGADGHFRHVNAAFVRVLGWSRDAVLATPMLELVHPDDRDALAGHVRALAAGVPVLHAENRVRGADGSWHWIAWRTTAALGEGSFYALGRDVTERRRTEQLDADQRVILELIARGAPLATVLERLTRLVEAQSPGMLASVLLLDGTGSRIKTVAAPDLPVTYTRLIEGEPIGPDAGSCGTAAYLRCLVVADDIATDPRWLRYRAAALGAGLRACWSLPIFSSRGEVLGTFAMYYREPRSPSPPELGLLEIASRMASIAIEREQATGTVDLLRRALDRISDIVLLAESRPDGGEPHITYASQAVERITGWSQGALRGAAADEPVALAALRRALSGAGGRGVVEITTREGRARSIEIDVAPVGDEADGVTRSVVIGRDVTERMTAEADVRDRQRRFYALASATNDAMYDWDLVEGRLWWSDGFYQQFGYLPEEAANVDLRSAMIHPGDREAVTRSLQEALDGTARTWTAEYRFLRKDGTPAWVVDRGVLLRDGGGAVTRVLGGMTDLTEKRAVELRIREQAALLDQISDAIVVENLDGIIRLWNRAAERLYGIPAAAAVGRRAVDIVYRDAQAHAAAVHGVREHGAWASEMGYRTVDGRDLVIDARWSLVRDEAGQPRAVLGVQTDVTEKRQMEAQYLRAQRLESIGNLAGGIAHDLNNVLTPILMSIPLLRDAVVDGSARETIDAVEQAAERGADMVKQVLSFARGVNGQRTPVDLVTVVHDVARIARDSLLRAIEVKLALPPRLSPVIGDSTQLHQVLINLVVNAGDAMPEGGVLSLGAEEIVIAAGSPGRPVAPGRYVVVRVSDTGTGIPAHVRDRMFEPFYTTKPAGQGTGLGLSTVLALVKAHGGFLDVHTEVGHGARFEIFLPAAEAAAAGPREPRTETQRGRGELILLVDDEAAVLKVTQRILEASGYRVITAGDGAEALALYAKHPEVAAVITDVMMPLMDGVATSRALLRLDPTVKIIATSGVATPATESRLAAVGVKHLVAKPFTADALLGKLREVLAGPAPQA